MLIKTITTADARERKEKDNILVINCNKQEMGQIIENGGIGIDSVFYPFETNNAFANGVEGKYELWLYAERRGRLWKKINSYKKKD